MYRRWGRGPLRHRRDSPLPPGEGGIELSTWHEYCRDLWKRLAHSASAARRLYGRWGEGDDGIRARGSGGGVVRGNRRAQGEDVAKLLGVPVIEIIIVRLCIRVVSVRPQLLLFSDFVRRC